MDPGGPPLDDEGHLLRWEDAQDVEGEMRFIFERLGGVLPDVGIADEEREDEEWKPFKEHSGHAKGVFRFVKLQIDSNWGHPESTCVYNFRVHRKMPQMSATV